MDASSANGDSRRPGSTRPVPSPDARVEEIDDELAIYLPGQSTAVVLNRTAAAIWRLCDGDRTAVQIATELAAEYRIPVTEAIAHTEDVLATLTAHACVHEAADRT